MNNKNTPLLATNGEIAVAQMPSDFISAEQYRTIDKLAAKLEINADQASRSLYDVAVEDLSKHGALDLIAYLKRLKGE